MSLPLVTRFGADPLLDLEVANKRYVDASGGGTLQPIIMTTNAPAGIAVISSVRYGMPINTYLNNSNVTTESLVQRSTHQAFTIRRVIGIQGANSRSEDWTINLRDDGVSVVTVVIGAGLVGTFDSGDITVSIAVDSEMNWRYDWRTGTGTLDNISFQAYCDP